MTLNYGPFGGVEVLRLGPTPAGVGGGAQVAPGSTAGDAEYDSWNPRDGGLRSVWVAGYFRQADGWPYVGHLAPGECFRITESDIQPPRSAAARTAGVSGADAGRATPAASDAPPVAAAGGAPFLTFDHVALVSGVATFECDSQFQAVSDRDVMRGYTDEELNKAVERLSRVRAKGKK